MTHASLSAHEEFTLLQDARTFAEAPFDIDADAP